MTGLYHYYDLEDFGFWDFVGEGETWGCLADETRKTPPPTGSNPPILNELKIFLDLILSGLLRNFFVFYFVYQDDGTIYQDRHSQKGKPGHAGTTFQALTGRGATLSHDQRPRSEDNA
jgi:hypothetical protein